MYYMETEEAVNEGRQSNETEELNLDAEDKGSGKKRGSTVSTARLEVHTANAPVSTVGVTISIVDPELVLMKEEKAKEKGVAFKDVEDSSRPVRSITTLKPLPSIDPKDKGNETKYPLTKEILERMMSLKLIAESASDGAYDLLRFIQMKIDEAGSYDGGKKDL
ncbi:hypothetical protein Tco_0152519 [Tanacetum coccineum]